MHINENILGEALKVPLEGIRSVVGKACSKKFMEFHVKMPKLNTVGAPKKFLKGGYWLFFKFLNKVMLPQSQKRIVASGTNFFVMENLSKFENTAGAPKKFLKGGY